MKEDKFYGNEIRAALSKMHDALGVNYTCFSEVMEKLDDMRLDLKPTPSTMEVVKLFRRRAEDQSREMNPVEFWAAKAKNCDNVLEAVRLYLEANANQYPGADIIKNRILFLANKEQWK